MADNEKFRGRLDRLGKWVNRVALTWQKSLSQTESDYLNLLKQLESEKNEVESGLRGEEERLRGALDQAGKDHVKRKYQFEKDSSQSKADVEKMLHEIEITKQQLTAELARLNQEKINNQISFERQKSALTDLYTEKKRQLLVSREKMVRELSQAETSHRHQKERYEREVQSIKDERGRSIQHLKEQFTAKKEGWSVASETMKKVMEALLAQKTDVEKQLNGLQAEKERELQNLRLQIEVVREQLELDKVTLAEQADEDQRRTEEEVRSLQERIAAAESDLQTLIVDKDTERKNIEDGFVQEEKILADTLKSESEKRDFEQKLFAQEKATKEKELQRLKDEFEKKKNQWDNQIKTLAMRKSLKEAESDAERARVDREARVTLRTLEAKRDEIKARLTEVESRTEAARQNSAKELDLLKQRWHWRKDRLWSMWQSRLDLLKKERSALQAQIEHLSDVFEKDRQSIREDDHRQNVQVEEMGQASILDDDRSAALRRQRNIQIELEKTRVIAQIKECETLVAEWLDRQKQTHQEFQSRKGAFVDDIEFLDQYYRVQQDETQLFLTAFQRALDLFKGQLERFGLRRQDAA